MRFRFLGDVDCPEWLLAQIYNLSQMTSSKMKMLSQIVIKSITDQELDEEMLAKISQDSKIEINELKALIAAVQMIFKSSARNAVSAADLSNELQQLGLPREHSTIITKFHTDNAAQISTILTGQSLRLSRLSSVEVVPNEEQSPFAKIVFKTTSGDENERETTLNISKDKLSEILAELKTVRTLMEQVSQ
ncbi:COMM domain-containing protein 4 [Trichogramma pretiosum]|uniref:COMM domain-containing protein 4 n=1 Tax=Trichogramma pretiosum TaxID=7493 RepID=UPI0006C945DF|nr:COMM domain-containing protein 4 [Trichogramma pretiosum]